jgi:hypothetical protein
MANSEADGQSKPFVNKRMKPTALRAAAYSQC